MGVESVAVVVEAIALGGGAVPAEMEAEEDGRGAADRAAGLERS